MHGVTELARVALVHADMYGLVTVFVTVLITVQIYRLLSCAA
jgi:hypothetical protein